MIKSFCDECGIEVTDPSSSLDMTGKVLCSKHNMEYQNQSKSIWKYESKFDWNKGKYPKDFDVITCNTCEKDTGYRNKSLMFLVLFHDLLCPHCGSVVIPANNGVSFQY